MIIVAEDKTKFSSLPGWEGVFVDEVLEKVHLEEEKHRHMCRGEEQQSISDDFDEDHFRVPQAGPEGTQEEKREEVDRRNERWCDDSRCGHEDEDGGFCQ